MRFSSDDRLLFRYNSKIVEVLAADGKQVSTLNTGILEFLEVSRISNADSWTLAAVYLDKKNNKGNLLIFKNDKEGPIYEKNINKAEEIKIKFSPVCNKFLI